MNIYLTVGYRDEFEIPEHSFIEKIAFRLPDGSTVEIETDDETVIAYPDEEDMILTWDNVYITNQDTGERWYIPDNEKFLYGAEFDELVMGETNADGYVGFDVYEWTTSDDWPWHPERP